MSADKDFEMTSAEPKITVDDVKRRAEAVRDLAVSEVKRTSNEIMHEQVTRTVMIGAVAVAVLFSFAFLMGTRRGKAGGPPPLPPYHCWPPE